jgi:hypothetical protein
LTYLDKFLFKFRVLDFSQSGRVCSLVRVI